MGAILATKTMAAINAALEADQGAAFRVLEGRVLPHIGDAYRGEDGGFRSHLGASMLGDECGRKLWYGFRWSYKPNFPGRILRLFNRGHLEEGRFIALLLMIGCEVYQQDADGKQYRISFAEGHAGGSGDGIIIGCPDLPPGTAAVGEFKTHNEKSFRKLVAEGVRDSKFEHFVQMQLYMRKMGLAVALYMAVNKNDDDIYAEIVHLDSAFADNFVDRGTAIVWAQEPPAKLSKSPSFFKCKWCDMKDICHNGALPEKNCRTCVYSRPAENATWVCGFDNHLISKQQDQIGCEFWQPHEAFKQ